MKKITVLGEGHFGTAIATILAHNGYEVTLWCYESEVVNSINSGHVNSKYFPELNLNTKIKATENLQQAIESADYIFQAIPVKFLRSTIENLKPYIKKGQVLISLSKGIEQNTHLFPSQIIKEILPEIEIAVVSGPSFAKEVVEQKLTAVNLATENSQTSNDLKAILQNSYFKIEPTKDILGLEICGALKNVITMGIGIALGAQASVFAKASPDRSLTATPDTANYSDNTIAYLFTKGLAEISLLTEKSGGNIKSVYDLAGVGDLVLCAFGKSSRNLWFGKEIGKGKKLNEILQSNNITVEGLNTLTSIKQLSEKLNLNLAFCNAIYGIVFENKNIESILKVSNE